MAENEKYVDGLTEAESEDMAIIVNKTINEICLFSDKHNFDRDNMLKYYTELISAFTEIATIQGFEAENPQTNADRIRNMSDEELAEFLTVHDLGLKGNDLPMLTDWLEWLQSEEE